MTILGIVLGVKGPLFARVPSSAGFFDNLTEITRVKEGIVEFFFH